MDITGKKIWQVAAGDKNRNYVDLCLRWGVILNGPGSAGPWPKCASVLRDKWKLAERKITDLKRFCEDILEGDIVVLRLGTNDVYGIGTIVGSYLWNSEFGDVDGWNLEHVRRVRWLQIPRQNQEPLESFHSYAMKLGDTVQILDSQDVKDWIQQLPLNASDLNDPIPDLPEPAHSKEELISNGKFLFDIGRSSDSLIPIASNVDLEFMGEFLFDNGVSSRSIKGLRGEIDELFRIARWYQKSSNPSEHETVAYLVVPLLRALGWTPQKMAIEWNYVDLALFSALPREDKNLSVVVEAKQKDRSCLSAKSQAESYALGTERTSCKRLLVTDGLRYGVYTRNDDGKFSNNPDAYLNLTRLRSSYPIYDAKGAHDALLMMSSDWSPA